MSRSRSVGGRMVAAQVRFSRSKRGTSLSVFLKASGICGALRLNGHSGKVNQHSNWYFCQFNLENKSNSLMKPTVRNTESHREPYLTCFGLLRVVFLLLGPVRTLTTHKHSSYFITSPHEQTQFRIVQSRKSGLPLVG